MTNEQINEIRKAVRDVFVDIPERHKLELQIAKLQLMQLKSRCNHKNPDGTSAIPSPGMNCKICSLQATSEMRSVLSLRMAE